MKAISTVVIAGLAALVMPGFPAWAQKSPISGFISGNKLLELCDAPFGSNNQAWCDGYIIGVDDALTITYAVSGAASDADSGETDPSTRRYYCLREGVTLGQTSLVVLNYLKAHPEKLDMIASQLVIAALAEAFPCSGQ
jgi:hypothetical protein